MNTLDAAMQIEKLADEAREDIRQNPLNAALRLADIKTWSLYIQNWMRQAKYGDD